MNPDHVHERLNHDLEFFAVHAPLLIKDKTGNLISFRFNKAQRYIHAKLEEQLALRGWVRALVVKGRQQGCSTYLNARNYHKVTRRPGVTATLLSHEGNTTNKLFDMIKRFHEHVHPAVRPAEGKSNTRQLAFPDLGSDFSAGTAGNEQVNRGSTSQIFQGSEAAYWEHAYAIQDGALKSIALLPGTEIVLESTANGPIGLFYDKCMAALKGVGDYVLIFIPWFWQEEYARDVDASFKPTEEEEAYMAAYFFTRPFPFDTTFISRETALRKIAWRRAEIVDLSTGENIESGRAKFRTIYPANPIEAFQATGVGLFRPDAITAARKSVLTDPDAVLIAGVDPAGDSDDADRTVISLRRGRHIEERLIFPRMRPMELAGIIAREIVDKRGAEMVFVDRGYGEGTIDRLREMGYGRRVMGIAFNERPLQPDIYMNKRSEIIIEYAKWINGGDVRIPDTDDGHAALACVPLDEQTSNGLKFLKSKREIKRMLGGALLLDIVDADALTFSYPVRRDAGENRIRKADGNRPASKAGGGPLKSLSRKRRH